MSSQRPTLIQHMNLDEQFAAGNAQREIWMSLGMPQEAINYMLETWIDSIVDYCGVQPVIANALASRWGLRAQWEESR